MVLVSELMWKGERMGREAGRSNEEEDKEHG
jgi:hypothetical protein